MPLICIRCFLFSTAGGNYESTRKLESLWREQRHHTGGRLVARHGRVDVSGYAIASSSSSQKAWKVCWHFSHRDRGAVRLPLFLIEVTSFALLALSPLAKLSSYTLFLLAGMFFVFAIWAVFGFAYPSAPIPIALNMISKVLAFATAVSLFLSPEKQEKHHNVPVNEASQAPVSSL